MINEVSMLVKPEKASEGVDIASQLECEHKRVKLYEAPNPANLAICLNCGALVSL